MKKARRKTSHGLRRPASVAALRRRPADSCPRIRRRQGVARASTFILYSSGLETGSVPLHIERGRGNRPDEASATCPTDMAWCQTRPSRRFRRGGCRANDERRWFSCPPPHFGAASVRRSTPSIRSVSAPVLRAARSGLRPRRAAPHALRASRSRMVRSRSGVTHSSSGRTPGRAAAARRLDTARTRAPARGGGRSRRALAEARHGEPDALVQGPRRRGRGREGARARTHDACVLVDRKPRECCRRARRGGGCRSRRFLPGRPRAGEADRHRDLRCAHLRRQRQL